MLTPPRHLRIVLLAPELADLEPPQLSDCVDEQLDGQDLKDRRGQLGHPRAPGKI
jgi:hypothetical protein